MGFPGSGKTTVFNALTGLAAETGYGAGKRGSRNLGVVRVPDARLDRLAALYRPRKTTYAEVTFADIAGGTASRELDRTVLNAMREVDALCQVLRGFDSPALAAAPDPLRELQDLQVETVLADLEIAEKRLFRLHKERDNPGETKLFERIVAHLEGESPLRTMGLEEAERRLVSAYQFLSLKPMLLVLNVAEEDLAAPLAEPLKLAAAGIGTEIVPLCASVEMDIAHMPSEERSEFYEALDLTEPARDRFLRAAFELLDLITMFTVGEDECRAWPVKGGSTAPRAASRIHSDIERGFIRAEVTRWDDLLELGSEAKCREAGKLRVEGRDYVVRDGDIVHFRFNV